MNRKFLPAAALAALMGACGGTSAPPEAALPQDPAQRLEAILASDITHRQDTLYNTFVSERGAAAMHLLLPDLALDREAPALARANAVLRMGQMPLLSFDVYELTIQDPDPRVRGATLGVVGPLATPWPQRALPILARGLVDPEIGIQAKALQELRDRDLELLRFYLARNPPPELRDIALETIRASEAWGAPLTPEVDGTLRRVTPAGVELALRPDTAWPQWDAAMGRLFVTTSGGSSRMIADSVEVVATIIPAVVDAGGRWIAIETARRIEVHDLETGAVRVVGRGVAPRPMPFTPDYLYFRELSRRDSQAGTRLVYEIVRAGFDQPTAAPFDTISVEARSSVRGYLSPLRWVRILDRGTQFVLETDGLRNHVLPTPMSEAGRTEADGSR